MAAVTSSARTVVETPWRNGINIEKLQAWLANPGRGAIDETLAYGCDGPCGPEPKTTLLGYAVAAKQKEVCEILLSEGADPNEKYYVFLELGGGSKVLHDCKINETEQWRELFP